MSGTTLWALIPVLVVVLGFALRQHPARVVLVAALSAGLVGGLGLIEFLDVLGTSFNKARYLLVIVLAFPVIAQMEAHGLRRLAARVVGAWRGVRTGRLLVAYLALRQSSAALGLTSLGGHPQMVRPLVAPMAEAAAEAEAADGKLSDEERQEVRAMAAATDNVGLFFGEDLFLAFGAVLLMQAYFSERGLQLAPLEIALWGLPTAVLAFLIHGARLLWRDRRRRKA
ncbi:MAG: 5-oxoproline transporter, DUF969 family subunit [Lysobacterales bacterium]